MSMPPEFASKAASISKILLGYNPSEHVGGPIKASLLNLRQAVKEAYLAGQKDKLLHESGVETELLFWQLMDSLPDHVYFKDLRSRFICVNMAQARFLGLDDPNDAIGKSDFDFFDHEKARERFEEEQEIIRSGIGLGLREETDLESDNERICIVSSKLPLRDAQGMVCGTFGVSRDVSTRYLAERELRRQRNLLDAIVQILPCRVFVRDLQDRFILVNEAYREAMSPVSEDSLIGRRLAEFLPGERHDKIIAEDQHIKQRGEAILNQIEYNTSIFEEERWVVTSKVPLHGPHGAIEGIVGMSFDITERKEAEEEARALGQALQEKNEQFEAELIVARHLQEKLMSMDFDQHRLFRMAGATWRLEAGYFYKPSHHLAGDFFELIRISDNRLGVLVCDVMGHGVKAALVTMLLRGLMMEMPNLLEHPNQVLNQLNKRLCALAEDQEFPRFVTAAYLMIDLEGGFARIANAGHPEPLWKERDSTGKLRFRPCPSGPIGPALGLIPTERFAQLSFEIEEGTELLFYTDGIIEQTDAMGRPFGIEKLETILLQEQGEPIPCQLGNLNAALRLTAGSDEFDDDICLVAVSLAPIKSPR